MSTELHEYGLKLKSCKKRNLCFRYIKKKLSKKLNFGHNLAKLRKNLVELWSTRENLCKLREDILSKIDENSGKI